MTPALLTFPIAFKRFPLTAPPSTPDSRQIQCRYAGQGSRSCEIWSPRFFNAFCEFTCPKANTTSTSTVVPWYYTDSDKSRQWQNRVAALPHNLSFPDENSINSLASLYFSNINPFIPVLHRPTFDECVGQQLHIYDLGFGSILLLVCALGSLYLTEPTISRQDREALGWKWYNQVELCGHSLHRLPAPHDIQAYCLAVQFLIFTSNPRRAWLIAGFGLRVAEDVGSHRNKTWAPTVTIHDDLEKRAFWQVKYYAPIFRHLNHYVTLPAECDDENWQPRGLGFQPQAKPSSMAFFNCLINLYRNFHLVLRTLYTIRVNQIRMESTHELPRLAAELDAALDKWFTSLPQHCACYLSYSTIDLTIVFPLQWCGCPTVWMVSSSTNPPCCTVSITIRGS
ncbi:fungal-specific transcription factor domain-containing protein [Mycena polygramma]|nr:fungal-specific transcription factor domain-containing protein [Mycena polygramma]